MRTKSVSPVLFLCSGKDTECNKHCVVECTAVMEYGANYLLYTGNSVTFKKRAGVVHGIKLDGSSLSDFCVAVRQMFWSIGVRMLETMDCCGNVPRH